MRRHTFRSIGMLKFRLFNSLFLSVLCQFGYAESGRQYPSEKFLEFLSEFDSVDNETFEMIMENGIRDVEKKEMDNANNQGSLKNNDGNFREDSKKRAKGIHGDEDEELVNEQAKDQIKETNSEER